jgi:F0F1-type ATP synthase membrane subunit b/b'
LKREVAGLAAQKAGEIIDKELDEKDQDNLVNEFIEKVGKTN